MNKLIMPRRENIFKTNDEDPTLYLLLNQMRQKIAGIISLAKNNKALLCIVAFYLALVFYNFFSQGLVNWDEAYFMVVANTFSDIIRTGLFSTSDLFSGAYYQNLMDNYGNIYTAARPSYIIPAIFINLLIPNEFSTRLVSVLAGLMSILYFYKILFFFKLQKASRLAATLLLAASPLFLTYARIGLSQIFSAALLLASSYYLLKFNAYRKITDLKLAAISLSLLLMSHYNTIFLVASLLLATLFVFIQNKIHFKKYILYALYFAIIPLIWEAITRLGLVIANLKQINTDSNQAIYSYFQEFANQFKLAGGDSGSFVFDQILYYPKLILSTEGIIILLLLIFGLFIGLRNIKKSAYFIVLIPALVHLLMFSIVTLKFPRNIITILPALYLLVVLGLNYLYINLKDSRGKIYLLIIFCLAIIALHGSQYKNYLNIQTNFPEITTFIQDNYEQDDTIILSSSAPIWRIYLPGWKVENVRDESSWQDALDQKQLIFISDYFTTIKPDDAQILDNVAKEKVKEVKTNIFQAEAVILDFTQQGEKARNEMFQQNQTSTIKVYQINSYE